MTSKEESTAAADKQTLLAIRCLDFQIRSIETTQAATRKRWADNLKEATVEFNERVRAPIPTADNCRGILSDIQELDREKQAREKKKANEIDSLKQKLAEAQSTFYELLRRTKNPNQVNLDFSGGEGFDPHAGLLLSPEHLDNVREAAEAFAKEAGEDAVDGMDELTNRLESLGVAGIEFPAEDFEPGDTSDAGENDGEDQETAAS